MLCLAGTKRFAVLAALATLIACGPPPATQADGGAEPDSGALDAGLPSDGGSGDAGYDAGTPQDAGTQQDAGTPDGGAADAGIDAGTDAGGPVDAGTDAGTGTDAGFDAGSGCPPPSGIGAPFRVRAVAANLTSGNYQSYDPGHGQRILQGLQPDVVMIQEFNYGTNSPTDLRSFVDSTFDSTFAYVRGSGQIPNGVVSRWPIVDSGEWTDPQVGNRTFTWAKIDLPGPRDLWVVSLHLLTSNAGDRGREATALVAQLNANVPTTDFLLVGGDFNTANRSETCVSTIGQRTVTSAPQPVDQAGLEGTNANRDKPYDWVLASSCLRAYQAPVEIGAARFDGGLVFDSRVYMPLTDVPPVLQSDSSAPQMQHMGVVKDFYVDP